MKFTGNLVLEPEGCQQTGTCTLGEKFGFIDSRGVGWEAPKGSITDGASIPRWAQIFVGIPFRSEYVRAAVLHDHYSKSVRPVRGWLETQWMFYEALKASKVSELRASILYAGVLIGSGKWIDRMEGRPCTTGMYCINNTEMVRVLVGEPESYETVEFRKTMAVVQEAIEDGKVRGRDSVEALVREHRPNDIYLSNPSGFIGAAVDESGHLKM